MYPTLKTNDADSVAEILLNCRAMTIVPPELNSRDFLDLELKHVKLRDGADVSIEKLYEIADSIQRFVKEFKYKDKYQLEEMYAEFLHESLRDLPRKALQDPDFWRYLALFPFRSYLLFRESSLEWQSYGGKSGTKKTHWLLPRTYLWGRKTWDADTDDYSFAHAVRDSRKSSGLSEGTITDFYHSHIVRLKWSSSTAAARGFIEGFITEPVMHDKDNSANRPSQWLSSRIGRAGNNICLPFIGTEGVKDFIVEAKIKLAQK
jgi:hypothetical protein